MGRRKHDSSESDEDSNVRHDRFRSERFKDHHSSSHHSSSLKSRESSHGDHSSKRYRTRSPTRNRSEKIETQQRKQSKNKYNDSNYQSNSSRYEKHDLRNKLSSQSQRKPEMEVSSGEQKSLRESDDSNFSKSKTKKLSSILMNFDKKVESKRLNTDSCLQIGPALPPHLAQKVEDEEELNLLKPDIDTSIGPALPPHLKIDTSFKNRDTNNKPDNSVVSFQANKDNDNEIKSSGMETSVECDTVNPEISPNLINPQVKNIEDPEKELQTNINDKTYPSSPPVNEKDEKLEHSSVLPGKLEENTFGPVLPPKLDDSFGPMLPPKLKEDSFGPALPPNFKKQSVQGPSLPSGITSSDLERLGEEESDDEDTFGPLPVGKMNMTQYQLELRAMDIKRKLEEEKSGSSKDIKKREEWMLELPPEKASNIGLGPRSFRMKEGPDMSNRSAWTDTPAEKKRKEEMALRGETEPVSSEDVMKAAFVKERNETMDKISKLSRDEDRQKSLLEIHQKKLKKKKKKEEKEEKKKERRPFDRNIDLQVHRFDEAQKKAIFKKAQLLDTRFSSGESKYL